jgi:hypothetical protein
LQLDQSKVKSMSATDDFDPETAPMAELERRAGGRQTDGRPAPDPEYVPTPSRFGSAGYTF